MLRLFWSFVLGVSLIGTLPAGAQVVETDPSPPRGDQPVTVYFNAEEGTAGLANYDGPVYAHTGISTSQNPEKGWKCVKNYWPTDENFSGNREDTRLTQVDGDPNRYRLEITDIRAYYQDTSTQCTLTEDEKIETMNFVFRNEDGSREGKAPGGDDIFVDVVTADQGPFLRAEVERPAGDLPLYPPITQAGSTEVKVAADTANVDALSKLRLLVDGTPVDSTKADSLLYVLDTPSSGRYDLRVEAEARDGDTTLTAVTESYLVRAPAVQDEPRPAAIRGGPGEKNGIHYNGDGSVTLSLYAPEKEFVYAIGDFSNWEIDSNYFMKRDGDHWWITLDGLNAGQQYDFQYFVDGEIRTSDPLAHKIRTPQDGGIGEEIYPGLEPYPGDQTENLVSVMRPGRQQPSFAYPNFQPPDREDLVIYELLVRDFLEKSSYRVLADTLGYLDSLGVNAVELMPVANFGGNSSWGYNPNAHLALDKSYGTPDGLRQFVEEAHRRGIAVFLDVVYNHITAQSPLSQLYASNLENPFLEPQTEEERGQDRGFCDDFFQELNHGSPFIKNYIDRANRYWIERFNVDGFRFDLAKCVADDGITIGTGGYDGAVRKGWKDVADYVWDNVDEDTHMILEFFGTPSQEDDLGGYRDDDGDIGSMMTWYNLNRPYSQADMGYLEGTDFSSDFSSSYYGNRSGYDQPSFIAYMESHDEQWLMRRKKAFGNGNDTYSTKNFATALDRQKLVGGFYFTVPGPKMMWQFGELGYGWGEDECLKESAACAESDPGRTAPKPVRWEYRNPSQSPGRVRLYKTWSTLIKLRRQHEVFTSPQTDVEMEVGDGDVIRTIRLSHSSMDAVVLGNFGLMQRDARITFQRPGTWYNVFASEAVEIRDTTKTVPLRPGELRIYTSKKPAVAPEPGLVPSTRTPPSRIPVSVNQSFGAVTEPTNYRLVALPGGQSIPLTEAAFGAPGDTWRAFYDDGSDSDYLVEYSSDDDRFDLGQGRGLWLLSEQSFSFKDTVSSVPVTNGRAQIALHDGWNIVSNPLSLDVDWGRVQSDNGISAPLYRWQEGGYAQVDTLRSARTGKAYYVNNATGLDSLSLPYPGSVADRQAAEASVPDEVKAMQAASTFALRARVGSTSHATVRLGYTESPSAVRHAAPRSPFGDVELSAIGSEQKWATHVVSTASDSMWKSFLSFPLRLSAPEGSRVSVQARDLGTVFQKAKVTLVNLDTKTEHVLRPKQPASIRMTSGTIRLKVRVGGVPENRKSLTPSEVKLHENYPNPFRQATTIRYDIPERMSVRLEVFDVLGRRVATLVRGERSAGQYEVSWNLGRHGSSMSSGVYFLRLKAGQTVTTRRVTLVQ